MQARKYPDGDCRRVGPGYKPRTSRGRGSGATIGGSWFNAAGMAPDAPTAPASHAASSGAGLSAMAGMMMLARLIGRRRAGR